MNLESLRLSIDAVEKCRRLPGTWQPGDYRRLLDILEVDDTASFADADLESLALMALQDHEAEAAMQVVLTHFSNGLFTKGQVQNLCEELKEERAWEEYPEIDHQRALYVAVDLLNGAFPYTYPEPAACRVRMTMTGNGVGRSYAESPIDAPTVLRAVARCQDDPQSILNRFFPDQLRGAAFPEANAVIWHLEASVVGADALAVTFYGSAYWFRGLDENE
jgi:hypothetical protein